MDPCEQPSGKNHVGRTEQHHRRDMALGFRIGSLDLGFRLDLWDEDIPTDASRRLHLAYQQTRAQARQCILVTCALTSFRILGDCLACCCVKFMSLVATLDKQGL